jgi:anti-sigma B factor antagonist
MDAQFFHARSSHDGDGTTTVSLHGELDLASADAAKAALLAAIRQGGPPITIDVSELTFIDAAGIRAIVAAQSAARVARQNLHLVRARGTVETILSLLGMIEIEPPEAAPLRGPLRDGCDAQ